MKSHHLRRWLLPLLVLGLMVGPAGAVAARPEHAAARALPDELAGALHLRWDARSQTVEFMAPEDPDARLPYTPSLAEQGNPEAIARGFLDQNRALFGLKSAADELRLLRIEPDVQLHYAHVRLDRALAVAKVPADEHQLVARINEVGIANLGIDLPDLRPQPRLLQEARGDVPERVAFLNDVAVRMALHPLHGGSKNREGEKQSSRNRK